MIRLKVKEVAEARGFNQSSLARGSNLGFSTIQRLFRDPYREVSTVTLEKIAKALDVSVHDLIEEVDDKPSASE
ncbi:XRE family transcriptional regulator [Ktedonosporobacter rubrisoli]|uniref:XRE family transcriptional regulator n=1 Tax=Ktedonosporobacter rubrisoli TaxID=2509675 RepID=A0A4P6JZP0_KTERU|nr:helix-turn-helix transcriptional regulator [Ktedonosporobacter rubrisoli]QBD81105.1 XRE family transcriptional regulator [Ktedonosporobacter rubrisoli]